MYKFLIKLFNSIGAILILLGILGIMGIPSILFALIGNWIDSKYGTIIGFTTGWLITMLSIAYLIDKDNKEGIG